MPAWRVMRLVSGMGSMVVTATIALVVTVLPVATALQARPVQPACRQDDVAFVVEPGKRCSRDALCGTRRVGFGRAPPRLVQQWHGRGRSRRRQGGQGGAACKEMGPGG